MKNVLETKTEDLLILKSEDEFIPGLELNRGFYNDAVKPLLEEFFPKLDYAAALIGPCSDVIGFDDYKSTDHCWGPRMQLFLREEDYERLHKEIDECLKNNLPFTYKGFPTNYKPVEGWFNNAYMQFTEEYPINHFLEIATVNSFFSKDIAFDLKKEVSYKNWLAYPMHNLLELTSGEIFHDGIGELTEAREKLRFFPEDVLLIHLHCLWNSISEEQAFIGRCHGQNDFIGESIILNRIVNKIMKMLFYYEKKYYSYSKWFGVAFNNLKIADKVNPIIKEILFNQSYMVREKSLIELYKIVVEMHNELGITEEVTAKIVDYYDRGYRGFDSDVMVEKIGAKIDWTKIADYDALSKVVLYDDSNCGVSFKSNLRICEHSIK